MENSKKYELIGNKKQWLYRIRYLKDIAKYGVKAGDLGGWLMSEDNLSQEGDCVVLGCARVYDEAQIYGKARVSGEAQVYGKAQVLDKTQVAGRVQIYGKARVYNTAQVSGNAQVYGDAQIYGNARVYGETVIAGEERVYRLDKARGLSDNNKLAASAMRHMMALIGGEERDPESGQYHAAHVRCSMEMILEWLVSRDRNLKKP